MRCKVVKFSELGNSWLPHDHILEAQLEDLLEDLTKKQTRLDSLTEKTVRLQKDIGDLVTRIVDKQDKLA